MRVSEAGGDPEWLTLEEKSGKAGETTNRWPDYLPGNHPPASHSTFNMSIIDVL